MFLIFDDFFILFLLKIVFLFVCVWGHAHEEARD